MILLNTAEKEIFLKLWKMMYMYKVVENHESSFLSFCVNLGIKHGSRELKKVKQNVDVFLCTIIMVLLQMLVQNILIEWLSVKQG